MSDRPKKVATLRFEHIATSGADNEGISIATIMPHAFRLNGGGGQVGREGEGGDGGEVSQEPEDLKVFYGK